VPSDACATYADQEWEPALAKLPSQHLRPAGRERAVFVPAGQPADVIELIMADHRRIRRLCEALRHMARRFGDASQDQMPAHVWQRLSGLLEVHTLAEEEICYLPMFACSPAGAGGRREAIDDHGDIREAIREASIQRAGSAVWWRAVRSALAANAEHLDREERDLLPHCLTGLTVSKRRELGRQWAAFIAAWPLGAGPGAVLARPVVPPRGLSSPMA
jgi:hypothetical protein